MGRRAERGDSSDKSMPVPFTITFHITYSRYYDIRKEEIHKRVHSELPAFDQQLSSSKYVQERLQALETNVDKLSDIVFIAWHPSGNGPSSLQPFHIRNNSQGFRSRVFSAKLKLGPIEWHDSTRVDELTSLPPQP